MNINARYLLISLFLLAVCAGGYFAYQDDQNVQTAPTVSALPTESWATYRNDLYGISFDYPTSYFFTKDAANAPRSSDLSMLASLSFNDPQSLEPILKSMRVYLADETPTATNFEAYLNAHPQHDANSGKEYTFDKFSQRTIGNNTFYYILTERFEGTLAFNYFTIIGNKVFLFQIVSQGVAWSDPNLDVDTEVGHAAFRQVLSTFRGL